MIEHDCIFSMTFEDGDIWNFEIDFRSMADIQVILSKLQEKYNDFDFKIQIEVFRV